MSANCIRAAVAMTAALCLALGASAGTWYAEPPCFDPGPAGTFDEVSAKDPTIVFHEGAWHVFYTARSTDAYTLGYVNAPTLAGLGDAPRHFMSQLSEDTGYAAAPQVFYYEPQGLWYLIFQTWNLPGEKGRYTPCYSTTGTITDPSSWTAAKVLVEKFERDKWIDFWVICDDEKAYLFYTRNHDKMVFMTTDLASFPEGFSNPTTVDPVEVHEAVCIYRIEEEDRCAMIVEINDDGRREFRVSFADALSGPWSPGELFAHGDDLVFAEGVPAWTTMTSHGELIRSGFDQRLEVPSLDRAEFLIQGAHRVLKDYPATPWSLGLIRNVDEPAQGLVYQFERR